MMKKKDLWIIVAAVVLALGFMLFSKVWTPERKDMKMGTPEGVTFQMSSLLFSSASAEEAPAADESAAVTDEEIDQMIKDIFEKIGLPYTDYYLIVYMGEQFQPFPILPEYADKELTINISETDSNTVKFVENGFMMSKASCPDQICITEGVVTGENREERILGSYIYCLPNQLALELVNARELMGMLYNTYATENAQ